MKRTLTKLLPVAIIGVILLTMLSLLLRPNVAAFAAQPEIPNKEGYEFTDTVIGGTFSEFDAGRKLGTSSATSYFWGTNTAYDYSAEIIDDSGNKVLKMGKGEGDKPYASAFVFIANEFSNGDFMTVEFDYKLNVESLAPYSKEKLDALDKKIDFSFAPATGEPHHVITLDGTKPTSTSGANQYYWPVTYSDSANGEGWTTASVTVNVNPGTLVANSLRWLMPITAESAATDHLLLDNVKIIRWKDTTVKDMTPELVSGNKATFDKKDAKALSVVINTKGEEISTIKRGGTNVNPTAYTKTKDGENVTITFKPEYLAGLDNATYAFSANTIEGAVSFEITITETEKKGCGSSLIGGVASISLTALAALALIAIIVKRKKA